MAKIFISYSRKDTKAAQKLITALGDMGHDVWVDWESILPASDWLEQIYHGIEEADAFLFLVSPYSIKSEVCSVEVGHAASNNKRIVPVVIQQVKPEDTNENIRKRNWVFLRRNDNYKDGLEKVKDAIELDFTWVEEHSRLQSRALEWDRKKDTSLLLRGSDLRRARRALVDAADKEPLPTDLQKIYVEHSTQNDQRRTILGIVGVITIIIMAGLAFFALISRKQAVLAEGEARFSEATAVANQQIAATQKVIAEENEQLAQENEQAAVAAKQDAEKQKLIAQAQRSAARAQIYQIQPDGLYTSTLLAVASWKTSPSDEADEILRKNISLLPIPVKQMYQEGGINSLEFNEARDLFVTGGGNGKACVWKSSDGELIFCTTSPKSVNDAVFTLDGEFIVTGDSLGEVQIVRILNEDVIHTYNAETIIWDIDIKQDGTEAALTRDDGKITILDLETGERKYDLEVSGNIRIASFSPSGDYIAAGSSAGVVTLWNLDAGGNPITSGRHKGEVLALTFSPDDRYLITGGADGYAVTARTTTGRELYRLLHEDSVTDIAFNSNDASWFATVSNDRRIRLWNTINGTERIRMSQDSFVKAVDVSANGQWLATTGADRTVRVWNASAGTQMFQIPLKGEGTVLGFGGDGNSLIAGDKTGEINVWDISVMPAPQSYLQFKDLVGDMQFSPSGEWIAASSGTRVWLLQPGQISTLTEAPETSLNMVVNGNVTSLAFSPDSNWLGITTDEGHVLVYSLLDKITRTFISSGVEHDIAFSPDSTHLFVLQPGGTVDAWDLKTREQIVSFAGGLQQVESLAVGISQIALGVENEIQILNKNGERLYSIPSLGDHSLLAFNHDETLLASSNSEGFIEIWELVNGSTSLVGSIRKETVYSMAFDPVGTQLAIGTTNTVYLIDLDAVEETARIHHADIVTSVSYSMDGNLMATSSLKAVQFWDVAGIQTIRSDDLVVAACKRMVSNFSETQWNNLFPNEEYWVLCENLPAP